MKSIVKSNTVISMPGGNEFYGFPGTKKKAPPPVKGWGFLLIGALVESHAVHLGQGGQDFLGGSGDAEGL